jgi:hypothetical protein
MTQEFQEKNGRITITKSIVYRAYKFPCTTSFNIALSKARSATIFLRQAFSFSCPLTLVASKTLFFKLCRNKLINKDLFLSIMIKY